MVWKKLFTKNNYEILESYSRIATFSCYAETNGVEKNYLQKMITKLLKAIR